jgi:hypothetical protein
MKTDTETGSSGGLVNTDSFVAEVDTVVVTIRKEIFYTWW